GCQPGQPWPCTPRKTYELPRKATSQELPRLPCSAIAPSRPRNAPLVRRARDTTPGYAPSCREECACTAAHCPEECPTLRRSRPLRPLPLPPDEGCSASRRRRSATAPGLRCDSGRIRSPPL